MLVPADKEGDGPNDLCGRDLSQCPWSSQPENFVLLTASVLLAVGFP